jgi:aspartyl-tRNA(Asn)/glutamyl-tRNA(Gln) amidotransferase subunit A
MISPADWTLTDTVAAVAARKVSALEVAQEVLGRIKACQPRLNAFVRVDADGALTAANAADRALASGQPAGLLQGACLAHKDMFYRPDVPVTCGSAIRRNFQPSVLATVLARLDGAGAITVGALNMSEFANGPTGHNVHFGPTRNPWHPSHMTGGSSSGSGTAVAARLAHGALGSDTGGSIRLPAGACGVYGIKPTQGRVSRHGAMGLSFSLDNIGPLARTARDCARLLSVVAGPDPEDPTAAQVPPDDYEKDLDKSISGLRIIVPTNYYWDDIDPEVGDVLETAIGTLSSLRASITRRSVPLHDAIRGLGTIVISAEFCTLHDDWLRNRHDDYSPLVRARMKQGYAFSAVEYLKAVQVRPRITKAFVEDVFGSAEAMLMPVLRFPVPKLTDVDVGDSERMNDVLGSINHCTWPINYLGLPGLAVPAGFSKSGLPVAFQLVGRPFAEAMLFRVAGAYERETRWPDRAPPLEALESESGAR